MTELSQAIRDSSPFLERLARFGFACKGTVYLILGALAALAPIGVSTGPRGARGTLAVVMREPLGTVLLAALAAGLLGFGLFQLLRAVSHVELTGLDAKALAKRVAYLGNALLHLMLVAFAVQLLI